MKKTLLFSVFLCITTFAFSQINYQKTLTNTLKLAQSENKPAFIFIAYPGSGQWDKLRSGLNEVEAVNFYNKNFICYQANTSLPELHDLIKKYAIKVFPAYIFLNSNGELAMKYSKNSLEAKPYIDFGNEVLSRIESKKTLADFDSMLKSDSLNKAILKEYISLRQKAGYLDNAKLIDQYVDFLTVREFSNPQEILFILNAGPYTFGKADKLASTANKVRDSIFNSLDLKDRIEINNRAINNTITQAIATKNQAMALNVANFTRNTHSNDYKEGYKQYTTKLLYYYRSVKDTANFFRMASDYYDEYYMKINADEIKKSIAENKEKLNAYKASIKEIKKSKTNPVKTFDKTKSGGVYTVVSSTITIGPSYNDQVPNVLNQAAWDFYTMGTLNNKYLLKALLWSKKSIEISPISPYFDTLAHVFYQLGFYDEAVLNQKKAIESFDKEKYPIKMLEQMKIDAKKMEERTLGV